MNCSFKKKGNRVLILHIRVKIANHFIRMNYEWFIFCTDLKLQVSTKKTLTKNKIRWSSRGYIIGKLFSWKLFLKKREKSTSFYQLFQKVVLPINILLCQFISQAAFFLYKKCIFVKNNINGLFAYCYHWGKCSYSC